MDIPYTEEQSGLKEMKEDESTCRPRFAHQPLHSVVQVPWKYWINSSESFKGHYKPPRFIISVVGVILLTVSSQSTDPGLYHFAAFLQILPPFQCSCEA